MNNAPDREAAESALEQRYDTVSDLFPQTLPPVAAASWPSPGTRAAEALDAFLSSGAQNQADYLHGWRLAAYVKELEYLRWSFCKRDIYRPGCRRAITEYEIDRQAPATSAALNGRYSRGFINLKMAPFLAGAAICAFLCADFLRYLGWI